MTTDPENNTIAVDEVDTAGDQSGVLSATTEQALDELPLAAAASEDLESDIVLRSSISTPNRWKRPALLLALVALLAIAISFGVSNNRANATNKGNTVLVQQVKKEQSAPAPAPVPKAAPAIVEVVATPAPTVRATDGGTATVAMEDTAPPTLTNRGGEPVIESPTWRG